MKASDLFVKALENEGVKYIFGIPGEENLDLLESLKHSDIEMVVTRHEQAAGFMAATVGRLTGELGVCMSTLGPGATNFTTSAAYAQLGGFPMMMITGQKPIKKSKQGRFQIIDVVSMMKPLTNYTKQLQSADEIAESIRGAFHAAKKERPGAVHLEFPEDIAREESEKEVLSIEAISYEAPSESDVARVAKILNGAKSPLLLVGAAGNRRDLPEALTEFVEKTGLYFMNTQMGKGAIDERSEKFVGSASLSSNDHVHCASDHADVILVVGHDTIEKPPFIQEDDGTTVIHMHYYDVEDDHVYHPQEKLIGDLVNGLEMLAEKLDSSSWDLSYFAKVKQEVDARTTEGSDDDRFPIIPQRLVASVREIMPSDSIVALDNGMYKIWFARHYKAHASNTLLVDNALATMGAGLPSAMAAKILDPSKKVVAVVGDGGFMMNSQELETAVRLGMNLVVVILNDSGYGMIKWKQDDMGFEDYSLDFNNPDFVKYAETYGAVGHRPQSCEEFEKTLRECLDAKGVHVIDLAIDYSENKKVSAAALKQNSCPSK